MIKVSKACKNVGVLEVHAIAGETSILRLSVKLNVASMEITLLFFVFKMMELLVRQMS